MIAVTVLLADFLPEIDLTVEQQPRPFICPICGRSYKRKASLKSHMMNECGQEPKFQCTHCCLRFKVKSNLRRHQRALHESDVIMSF